MIFRAYDSIYKLGFEIPFYGDHISLFTLLMCISTLMYTHMNSPNDWKSNRMKFMMYLMPVLFLGFFNNYASTILLLLLQIFLHLVKCTL